jgi:hypothetical protein
MCIFLEEKSVAVGDDCFVYDNICKVGIQSDSVLRLFTVIGGFLTTLWMSTNQVST